MEELDVKNLVEKIGENVLWGQEQEVALLLFENWKGEYFRIEDGEDIVDEIDRQDGWTNKEVTFHDELIHLKAYSKVRYVASNLGLQMSDDR
jgi:hypothetical protein